MIEFIASERHFIDHLLPVWEEIPPAFRGAFYVPIQLGRHRSIPGVRTWQTENQLKQWLMLGSGIIVTAAIGDYRRGAQVERPQVLMEHGAGQSYSSSHPSYAGGAGRHNVVLFLCPNTGSAMRNQRVYPHVPSLVIGCPKLDRWHVRGKKERDDPPTVAISFHWDCQVCPETRSSWAHYQSVIPELAKAKAFKVIGHAHPRIINRIAPTYREAGIEIVTDFAEIMDRADLYAVDNSSTLYEFASTDRPVVVLNAPWYRRDVNHGLRFWQYADVGVQVDQPNQLIDAIVEALNDSQLRQDARRAAISAVYGETTGNSTNLAVRAILRAEAYMQKERLDTVRKRVYMKQLLVEVRAIRYFYYRGKPVYLDQVLLVDPKQANRLERSGYVVRVTGFPEVNPEQAPDAPGVSPEQTTLQFPEDTETGSGDNPPTEPEPGDEKEAIAQSEAPVEPESDGTVATFVCDVCGQDDFTSLKRLRIHMKAHQRAGEIGA